MKPYRDAVVFQALGRTKPAVEVGSYNFQGLDFQFAWPDPTKDYDGVSVDGGDTSGTSGGLNGRDGLERRIKNINAALQAGQYVEYFDARARHLIGTWVQDPQISDIEVGWRQVSASLVEVG